MFFYLNNPLNFSETNLSFKYILQHLNRHLFVGFFKTREVG